MIYDSKHFSKIIASLYQAFECRRKKEFIRLLRQEILEGNFELTSKEWEAFGLSGLIAEWEQTENDFWDEEFQRQNQS